jgi:hypothetical protein
MTDRPGSPPDDHLIPAADLDPDRPTQRGRRPIQRVSRTLTELHGRLDEARVQLSLADLDLRDRARLRFGAAQNAYLAARARLADAGHDAGIAFVSLGRGLEQVGDDLQRACRSAAEAARRERAH